MVEWTKIFNQVSQLRIKSVTDSLFKFGLISLLISIFGAIFIDKDWVLIVLFGLSIMITLIGLIFYCYFAIKNPDYLRSETYQLKKQAVEYLGDNEKSDNKNIRNIPSLMNPYFNSDDEDENPLLK